MEYIMLKKTLHVVICAKTFFPAIVMVNIIYNLISFSYCDFYWPDKDFLDKKNIDDITIQQITR